MVQGERKKFQGAAAPPAPILPAPMFARVINSLRYYL